MSQPLALAEAVGAACCPTWGGALLDYGPSARALVTASKHCVYGRPADPLSAPGTPTSPPCDFAGFAAAARAAAATTYGPVHRAFF